MMLASLPMYDLPELRRATDAWWQGLAKAFRRQGIEDVPDTLERAARRDLRSGGGRLLFGQCCGYDLIRNPESLALVATPAYCSPHCSGASYRSLIVVGDSSPAAVLEDLKGGSCAINMACSHSGYTALRHSIAPLADGDGRFFSRVEVSGSHADSLVRVREGQADCTSVDCVTFALLARHRAAALQGLRVLAESAPAPGLPYVTGAAEGTAAGHALVARLRDGLSLALEDPALAAARDALLIEGIEILPLSAYDRIGTMEAEAGTVAPLSVEG